MTIPIIIGAILILIVGILVSTYNSLVGLRNRFKNAFAQIDVQLKRRYDLIPNLVESAKAYMSHERETLEAVIKARNQAVTAKEKAASHPDDPDSMKNLLESEAALGGAMGKLLVTVERYPEFKADKSVSALMEELTSTENKIAFARQAYNDAVMTYNTKIEVFPNIIFAGALGFRPAVLFEVSDSLEKEAPKVTF